MGENKGQTIFLSVIGIATLLVAIIGATFAYFTTTMTDAGTKKTGSQIKTAVLKPVTFTVTPGESLTDVFPGASFNPTTVEVDAGELPQDTTISYVCTVSLDSQAGTPGDGTPGKALEPTDIEWSATAVGETGVTNVNLGTTTTFSGTLVNGTPKDTWTVSATFKNIDDNQNALQGATATIQVACSLQGEIKYTSENHN